MKSVRSSSIRVGAATRKRVGEITRKLGASSQEEVVARAIHLLDRQLFWEGFDEEASEYLRRYPNERVEREIFGRTSPDGMRARHG